MSEILLSIIIPCFNERGTIEEIIKKVKETPYIKEIIIVDDGSKDGTKEFLEKIEDDEIRVFFHEKNRGKGAAIRTALSHARGKIVLIQDADLEYDPKEYPKLLAPILEGKADVVYGSRFLCGPHRVLYFWHFLGNKFLTFISNLFTNLNLSDMETGYKVFKREALEGIKIESDRFGFEPEITAKISKKGLRIFEVPISYYGRRYEEGKKITWKDGIFAIFSIIKYNLFRR